MADQASLDLETLQSQIKELAEIRSNCHDDADLIASDDDELLRECVFQLEVMVILGLFFNYRITTKLRMASHCRKSVKNLLAVPVRNYPLLMATLKLALAMAAVVLRYLIHQNENKRKAYQEVSDNFRSVMHHLFLGRFLHPADWFENELLIQEASQLVQW